MKASHIISMNRVDLYAIIGEKKVGCEVHFISGFYRNTMIQ